MSTKWLDTGYLRAKPQEVDSDAGIIRGVKICTEGPAAGHGVSLEREFIDTVAMFGAAKKQGLKARFGHPNMCSTALGTFLGRFKNFSAGTTIRDDGSEAWCAFADLFLSNEAKETPNGNLHAYVLGLAKNESDVFGTSIVFEPGKTYRRNEAGEKVYETLEDGKFNRDFNTCQSPVFVECDQLHACDCVDEPAANDGLFSAFANETIAGQVTEFFDLHPQIFDTLLKSPEILKALSQYGSKIDEFMARYTEYRAAITPEKGATMDPEQDKQQPAELGDATPETTVAPEAEAPAAVEPEAEAVVETEAVEVPEAIPPAADAPPAEPEAEPLQSDTIDRSEFARSVADFGAELTATAFAEGGGYSEAQTAYFAAIVEENKRLKEEVATQKGATPAEFREDKGKKITMTDIVAGRTKRK